MNTLAGCVSHWFLVQRKGGVISGGAGKKGRMATGKYLHRDQLSQIGVQRSVPFRRYGLREQYRVNELNDAEC